MIGSWIQEHDDVHKVRGSFLFQDALALVIAIRPFILKHSYLAMRFSSASLTVLGLASVVKETSISLLLAPSVLTGFTLLKLDDVALTMDLIGNYTASAAS